MYLRIWPVKCFINSEARFLIERTTPFQKPGSALRGAGHGGRLDVFVRNLSLIYDYYSFLQNKTNVK